MILEKLYSEFIDHTGLSDGIYKTVFIQISDVLEIINEIKWLRLHYSIDEQKFSYEFLNRKPIPLFVIEIMQNLFYKFFTFPDNSIVQLDLEYKGIPYSIIANHDDVTIPDEISFIKDNTLLNFFIITRRVHDIFREFDSLFVFTNNFKLEIADIFEPLEEQFKIKETKQKIDRGEISSSQISNKQSVIEVLKTKRKELLNKAEVLISEKNGIEKDHLLISKSLSIKSGLVFENNILKTEYAEFKDSLDKQTKNYDKVLDIISKIDVELIGLNSVSEDIKDTDEIEYLISKKSAFVSEKIALENSSGDLNGLMGTISIKLKEIGNRLKKIESYSDDDIDILSSKMVELEEKLEATQVELLSIENTIKQQSKQVADDSSEISSAITEDDTNVTINELIVDHLTSSLQPNSVTVVLNYLRYYFAFHTTNIASRLETIHADIDISYIQAISCRLALVKCFGVYFNNVFSLVDFADNRVGHVSLIEIG